jgi:hypothetical protein
MTALTYFRRITGTNISIQELSARRAEGGFFFVTRSHVIAGTTVNVTLRGGSSSAVTVNREVYGYRRNFQPLFEVHSQSVLPGVPTLDITNPNVLAAVLGRVEFTNRTMIEIARNQ